MTGTAAALAAGMATEWQWHSFKCPLPQEVLINKIEILN
jgi:hypothetical protein